MNQIFNSALFFLVAFSFNCFSQSIKIKKNEIDEFTGNKVIETSIGNIFSKGLFTTGQFRLSKINNFCFLEILYVRPEQIFSINENAELIFLLDDKTTYKLYNLKYVIADAASYQGATSWGANIQYINREDVCFQNLDASRITKLRMYLRDGYVEFDVKPKNSILLSDAIKLLNSID